MTRRTCHTKIGLCLFLLCLSMQPHAEPLANPFTILLEHAKQGNVDAMFEVAKFYQAGEYTDQNWQAAINWYEKASENNHTRAMLYLGKILLRGAGPQKADIPRALQLIQQAANAGVAEAQFLLGQLYEKGEYVEQDLPSAIRWYRAAELQKYPRARMAMRRSIEAYKTGPGN